LRQTVRSLALPGEEPLARVCAWDHVPAALPFQSPDLPQSAHRAADLPQSADRAPDRRETRRPLAACCRAKQQPERESARSASGTSRAGLSGRVRGWLQAAHGRPHRGCNSTTRPRWRRRRCGRITAPRRPTT